MRTTRQCAITQLKNTQKPAGTLHNSDFFHTLFQTVLQKCDLFFVQVLGNYEFWGLLRLYKQSVRTVKKQNHVMISYCWPNNFRWSAKVLVPLGPPWSPNFFTSSLPLGLTRITSSDTKMLCLNFMKFPSWDWWMRLNLFSLKHAFYFFPIKHFSVLFFDFLNITSSFYFTDIFHMTLLLINFFIL